MRTCDFPQLSDFSPDELIYMADEHDDESFALAMGLHPAMKKEPGFYEILTGIKDPFANMAFGMVVPDADNRVRSITNQLIETECPGYFWVGPCTKPSNLGEILESNGWKHLASPPAMAVDISQMQKPSFPENLALERVRTTEQHSIWQETVSAGFHLSPEVTSLFGIRSEDNVRFYTAFLDSEPVGSTALVTYNGVAGIYCVSTLAEFRGRGIGAALTYLPLMEAHAEGYQTGTLQASKMGYPVYRRLGFIDVCNLQMYGFGIE